MSFCSILVADLRKASLAMPKMMPNWMWFPPDAPALRDEASILILQECSSWLWSPPAFATLGYRCLRFHRPPGFVPSVRSPGNLKNSIRYATAFSKNRPFYPASRWNWPLPWAPTVVCTKTYWAFSICCKKQHCYDCRQFKTWAAMHFNSATVRLSISDAACSGNMPRAVSKFKKFSIKKFITAWQRDFSYLNCHFS